MILLVHQILDDGTYLARHKTTGRVLEVERVGGSFYVDPVGEGIGLEDEDDLEMFEFVEVPSPQILFERFAAQKETTQTDAVTIHDLMCGECGGETFRVKLITQEGVNSITHPGRIILACMKPSCPGAWEVKFTRPEFRMDFNSKSALMTDIAAKKGR